MTASPYSQSIAESTIGATGTHGGVCQTMAGRPAGPLQPLPRLLSTHAAAAYVGCRSETTFLKEVRHGIWPAPLPLDALSSKRKRLVWDVRALDVRIDQLHGATTLSGLGDVMDLDKEMDL